MSYDHLHPQFNALYPLTSEAWADISALFEEHSLEKNEYLLREGQREHHAYVLLDGVIRVFYNKDGNEYNKTFFTAGMFPTALTALLTQEPSQLNFQALTSCSLIRFPFAAFRKLFSEHHCVESFFRRVLEEVWIEKERHDIRMVTNDATTNYLLFREEYPGLEQLIPQYHIASHLGITPIQLSRIRAQLQQEK